MNEQGLPARRSAIWLLDQIMGEGKLMSELIAGGGLAHLQPADRARAQRLATEISITTTRCSSHMTR